MTPWGAEPWPSGICVLSGRGSSRPSLPGPGLCTRPCRRAPGPRHADASRRGPCTRVCEVRWPTQVLAGISIRREGSRPNTAKRLAPRGRTTRVSPSSTTSPVVSVITLPCVTRTSIVPRSGTRPRRARADRIWRLHAASCSELTVFRSVRLIARREKASRAVSRVRQNGLARTFPTRALSRRTPRPMARASAPSLCGEVALRPAVGEVDRLFVELGIVGCRVPYDQQDATLADRAAQGRDRRRVRRSRLLPPRCRRPALRASPRSDDVSRDPA